MSVDPALVELIERTAAETRQHLEASLGVLRGEMTGLRHDLRGEMAGMRDELRGEMAGMRDELRGEMAGMRHDLRGEMVGMRHDLRGEMVGMREELRGEIADVKRHSEVIAEDLRDRIQLVAEGVAATNERLDARIDGLSSEMREEFASLRAMFGASHRDLDRRVSHLESGAG